jgi:hypothetical protein
VEPDEVVRDVTVACVDSAHAEAIVPSVFNRHVAETVAEAVARSRTASHDCESGCGREHSCEIEAEPSLTRWRRRAERDLVQVA